MIVDRTTWVTSPADKTPIIYRLDTQLLIPLYVLLLRTCCLYDELAGVRWAVRVFVDAAL